MCSVVHQGRARGRELLRVGEPEPGEHERRAGNDKHANPSHAGTLAHSSQAVPGCCDQLAAARPAVTCQ
jgi:hypothetical protein